MLKLGVERGTPPMYDEEKDEMIGATGTQCPRVRRMGDRR